MNKLLEARDIINDVDTRLVELFEKRMQAVKMVIEYKIENKMEIFDSSREQANIERTSSLLGDKSLEDYFIRWYKTTMDISKDYQKDYLKKVD